MTTTEDEGTWHVRRDQTDKRGTRRLLSFEVEYTDVSPMRIDVKIGGTTSQVANAGDELRRIVTEPDQGGSLDHVA